MKAGAWLAICAVGAMAVFHSLDGQQRSTTTSPSDQQITTEAPAASPPPSNPPAPAPAYYAPSFHNYACTVDCSGHEAGYAWAEEHGITDSEDCGGNSDSFIEGCQAYAKEQNGDEESEDEGSENEDE